MQKVLLSLLLQLFLSVGYAHPDSPRVYYAIRTNSSIAIDGKAKEKEWQNAKWSDPFVDIEGDIRPKPNFSTRMKMIWDEQFLYVYAKLEETDIWGTLTTRDAIIFQDHDFEIFIDPDNDTNEYTEIEINALGTIMDLFMTKPYKKGGPMDMKWDVKDLKSAVKIKGTINKNNDRDKYWTVEMAIPVSSLSKSGKVYTPLIGSFWRINFSRVQWLLENEGKSYKKRLTQEGKRIPERNWVWSPQGVIDMHVPEKWGYVYFIN